jgi:glycosyltransferase involved in cell wall biosynthesis
VARRILGWREEKRILFVGRLEPNDRADFSKLFSAVRRVQSSVDYPVHLVVAGFSSAPNRTELALRRYANAVQLYPQPTIKANVSDVEKHIMLDACDVFVSPSNTFSESFGLTLVEAMHHRRPVVASQWGPYGEIIRDGIDGLLVPVHWRQPISTEMEVGLPRVWLTRSGRGGYAA